MQNVENFIYQFDGNQREILFYFHNLLTKDLNLIDKIRYKIPFYYRKRWLCYMNPIRGGKIELAFIRGNELSNEQGLLQHKNRKQILGVEFERLSDIPFDAVNEIIQEAILLDEITPYQSKKKNKSSN
jgi:hypothetical protein